ncbi:hypothetical protein G6F46_015714 [Rhizopus delemar]|nr:hypothetical protein G6F46_015714 [Rhizopus delemar]
MLYQKISYDAARDFRVLSVVAGGDIGLKAAEIRNAGKNGITQLVAGGNLDLVATTPATARPRMRCLQLKVLAT